MGELISYQLKGSVATVTMNDGKANVVSLKMLADLNTALDQAVVDNAIVVLTGRQGMFSAGFDLSTLISGGTSAVKMLTGGFELAERLLLFPKPVVIGCTGHALAMGAFLVLCGDYRIGVDGPYKIGANEVAIGLTMPRAAIEICRNRLASGYFNRSVLTSEIFSPAESIPAGFLDKVVNEADFMNEAQAIAHKYSKLSMSAYKDTKSLAMGKMLKSLRAAIKLDNADFRALYGKRG